MDMRNMLTRWTRVLRRRRLVAQLCRVDDARRRLEALPVLPDRLAAQVAAHRLEVLCVERARLRYFIASIDERARFPSAVSTYRRHERAVDTNCSSGHSPRFRNSLPKVTHK